MKKVIIILFILLGTAYGVFFWKNREVTTPTQNNFNPRIEAEVAPTTTAKTPITESSYDKKPKFFPGEAYDTFFQGYDFNRDGKDEYITYYHRKITLKGQPVEKQYLNVYRYNGTSWVVDHADEGTEGGIYLDKSEFLSFADIDSNGTPEVWITKNITGTGNYRQSYFLVWNGAKISEIFLPHIADMIKDFNLTTYLKEDETFSGSNFFTRQGNYITICGNDEPECSIRNSNPNARGDIHFDLVRKNNVWKFSNFKRTDYTTP